LDVLNVTSACAAKGKAKELTRAVTAIALRIVFKVYIFPIAFVKAAKRGISEADIG
jgi:hypothetical protein